MKYPKAVGRLLSALSVLSASSLFAQNSELPLEIYWIDVEGGSSTLIVTPTREAVLMDAGWNREDARDALRIQAAMQDAGITEIDYKDVRLLRRFVNDQGKIMPRRVTGTSAKMHRKVVRAIRRARSIALMPYMDTGSE